MTETIILGLMSFIGTNLDDIFINMIFYSQADSKAQEYKVLVGKYAGIGALVLISVLSSVGVQLFLDRLICVLGIVPIALGIKEIVAGLKKDSHENTGQVMGVTVLKVALITIANGADNIGVYVSLFAGFEPVMMIVVVLEFAVMIWLWCLLSRMFVKLTWLERNLKKYKSYIVPAVYILLGIFVIFSNL